MGGLLVEKLFFSLAKSSKPELLIGQHIKTKKEVGGVTFLFTSFLASLIFLTVLSTCLWSRLTVVNLGFEISKAYKNKSLLVDKNRRFRIELMKLKSPERIEQIALTELGLVYPKNDQVMVMKRK